MMSEAGKYDVSNTMFSPEGRLFQVEYAREAIKKGSTVLAMKYSTGVAFMTRRPEDTHIVIESSTRKFFRIDDRVCGASSGLMADARVLVDYCRYVSTRMVFRYDEPISVELLVKRLGNVLRDYTQHGGVRPFGVAFFIGGIDSRGIHLFETDISGAIRGYKAAAIGRMATEANGILEGRKLDVKSSKEAIDLLGGVFRELEDDGADNTILEVMTIDSEKGFSIRSVS